MTTRIDGVETTVTAGKGLSEVPGKTTQVGNNGSSAARWVADIFVPKGSTPSTPVAGSQPVGAPVTPTYSYQWKELMQPGSYDLVQLVQDFAPGAWTAKHKHGGSGVITVIEGELTVRSGGVEKVYKTGDSFTEEAGQVFQAGNAGTVKARAIAGFLLPTGAALATPVP